MSCETIFGRKKIQKLIFVLLLLRSQSRLGVAYQPHSFWVNMLDSLYQSLVIFFVAQAAYNGSSVGVWEFGTTITTSCLVTMLAHGAVEIKSWVSDKCHRPIASRLMSNEIFSLQTILHVLSIVVSLISYYAFAITYNSLCVKCFGLPSTYWVIFRCMQSPEHWLIILLTVVVSVLPR